MEQFKQIFRRMNLDSDARDLKPGEYRKLWNGIPVKPSIDKGEEWNICNIIGNELLTNSALEANSKVLRSLEDRSKKRIFYFVYNPNGNHTIYMYDPYNTGAAIVTVMRTSLFDFASTDIIDADIAGDILIFTNNRNEIKKINVALAIAGATYTPTLDEITLVKRPPQLPIEISSYGADGNPVNLIQKLHFQFFYQYVYEDNDYSAFSAVSKTAYATNSADNTIVLSISADEVIPETVRQINFAVRVNETNEMFIYKKMERSGGSFTLSHGFINNSYMETVSNPESVKWNDSVPKYAKSLRVFKNRVFTFNNTEGYDYEEEGIVDEVGISYASVGSAPVGLPYYKDGAGYDFGIMFFDGPGRHAGASYIGSIRIPDDRKGTATLPYEVTVDLSALSIDYIPTWAKHFSIVRTNADIPFFICDRSADVMYFKREEDGTITYNKTYAATNDGLAIDISPLSRNEIGYTLQAGDRIKIYSAGNVHSLTFGVFDLEIKSQDGRFLYTDLKNLGASLSTIQYDDLRYEIYTPATASIKTFFEVGEKYEISNPGTISRALSVTSITPNGDVTLISRDIYNRTGYSPTDPYANTLTANSTLLFESANAVDKYFGTWIHRTGRAISANTINSQEKNKAGSIRFSQPLIQNGSSQLNTFEALDEYPLPVENGVGVQLSEADSVLVAIHESAHSALYIGEGFVNTTDANNFLAKTDSVVGDDRKYAGWFGTTVPLSVVERDGRVYSLDLIKGVVIRRSQDGLTIISDYGVKGYIADICYQYRTLESTQRRIIGGWDPQYECYTLSFYQTGGVPISYPQVTLYFHEKSNSWVALSELNPEAYGIIGDYQVHFTAGAAYIQSRNENYNNWFGVQYYREFAFEPAPNSTEKIWQSISVDIESIYDTGGANETVLLLYDKEGGTLQTRINYLDFTLRASSYWSPFFRSINDQNFGVGPAPWEWESEDDVQWESGEIVHMEESLLEDPLVQSKYKSQLAVRGQTAYMNLLYNGTDRNPMKSISIIYRHSQISLP